jgi:hypothetical protein
MPFLKILALLILLALNLSSFENLNKLRPTSDNVFSLLTGRKNQSYIEKKSAVESKYFNPKIIF